MLRNKMMLEECYIIEKGNDPHGQLPNNTILPFKNIYINK